MNKLRIICFAHLLLMSLVMYAQDSIPYATRPKVGLVLSGGGAKGAAHIGVLKYIEEAGIPIDFIAGNSMGAVMGGMYALGYSTDEIIDIISTADWNRLISNNVDRRKISYQRKMEKNQLLLNMPFSVNISREDLQATSFKNSLLQGFVSGDNVINLFNSLAVGYSDSLSFDDLSIPFICIATDMLNGEPAVLDKGEFTKALRASMAIPILFDPIKMNQTLYTDGGLTCNFPAEHCRAMGADYVIGVSMSPGLQDNPNELSSIFSQIKQLKEIITDKDVEQYHEHCDIFIRPDLKGVGMLSFDAASVARVANSGYEAAAAKAEMFDSLKSKIFAHHKADTTYKKIVHKHPINIIKNKVLISQIEFEGVGKGMDKWLRRACKVKIGDIAGKQEIDRCVSIYFGTGVYKSVTYTLHNDPTTDQGYILRFKFIENPPHEFGLGFRFDTQDMLSVLLHCAINNNKMNGFKTYIDAKLGGNQWLKVNASYGHLLYPKINLAYHFRNSELDVYDMDELDMNEKFLQHKFRLFLSENYTRTFSVGIGVEAEILTPRKVMYSQHETIDADYRSVHTLGTFAYLSYDNLDKNRFATRGVKGRVDFKWKDCTFGKSGVHKFQLGSLVYGFEGYIPVYRDRFVIVPQLYGSFLFGKGAVSGRQGGTNPIFQGPVPQFPYMNNIIGGAEMGRYIDHQLPFIGVNKTSFAFNNVAIARADFRVRVYRNHYLTAMVNYARSGVDWMNFWKEREQLQWSELYEYNASNWWGVGIRYSLDTKAGPIHLDISSSNISPTANVYISFGYFF